MLALLSSFMERPIIKDVCEPKYKLLTQMIDAEMDAAKRIYDHHVAATHILGQKTPGTIQCN